MTKRIDTASVETMSDEQVKRERASIARELDDLDRRIKTARATGQESQVVAEVTEAVGRARLRVIALARVSGGAIFARMMRPFDDDVGDNVVRFRRRVR